jgi:RHS repeat-associated protein
MRQFTTPTSSVLYYLHSDHLGSTSLTTNSSGGVIARQLYDAWGNVRYVSGKMPTDFAFTGKRVDATGLVYLGARYYSASVGHFVSADTIVPDPKLSRDFNRYAYGGNNPLTLIDINGHQVPPQCSGSGICSTGTGGPYVVTIAGPQVQPLTVGTSQSKNDVHYAAAPPRPDDGLYIVVTSDTRTFLRGEGGVHASAEGPLANSSYERRYFYQQFSDGTTVSGWEQAVSAGLGPQAMGTGGSLGIERSVGDSGARDTSITASGKLFGAIEATGQIQGTQVMAGFTGKWPSGGGKISIHGGLDLGMEHHFITTQGHFDNLGGEAGFLELYGRPGGQISFFARTTGPFAGNGSCAISGFDLLLQREQRWYQRRQLPMLPKVVP